MDWTQKHTVQCTITVKNTTSQGPISIQIIDLIDYKKVDKWMKHKINILFVLFIEQTGK